MEAQSTVAVVPTQFLTSLLRDRIKVNKIKKIELGQWFMILNLVLVNI